MNFLLFIIASILAVILYPIGFLYSGIKFLLCHKHKFFCDRASKYFRALAISIDQLGNVIMQDLFNDIFINKHGYRFGNEDETISSVIGKNRRIRMLTRLGTKLDDFLDLLDKNHSFKCIEDDEGII